MTTEAFYVQRSAQPSRHFLGGPSLHSGVACPECARAVTLIWDLDLDSPQMPAPIRNAFGTLRRLPLYVCSQCLVLSYRIVDDEQIACFPHDRHFDYCHYLESPHHSARVQIERQRIHLHAIPPVIDRLWCKSRSLRLDESFTVAEKMTLQNFYESLQIDPVDSHYYSQLGGSPYWIQNPREMPCPNSLCRGAMHGQDDSQKIAMKRLAHIAPTDSPGLGDSILYTDFQFLVCSECFSIRVQYECT